jgi:hypothetical protein
MLKDSRVCIEKANLTLAVIIKTVKQSRREQPKKNSREAGNFPAG